MLTPTMHPFDAIAFDGDGRGMPDVEPEDAADLRRQWQAINSVEVPSIR